MKEKKFAIIDTKTGEEARWGDYVNEEWFDGLAEYDMEGFAVTENGDVVLLDECGHFRYCPPGCFAVVWDA